MEYNRDKIRIVNTKRYGDHALYYDITDQIAFKLPDYITKVEVCFEDYYNEEYDTEEWLRENFDFHFDKYFNIDGGDIRNDTRGILITFRDGHQLLAWNSEWGGITFLDPEKEN